MKFKNIIICVLLLMSKWTIAQSLPSPSLPNLAITWQPIENNYLGKEQSLSVLEIKNNGKLFLPAKDWKLYFNFIRLITPKSEDQKLDIHHVNGDLFYFTPNDEFKGLKPGESIRYELIANSWLVNVSDAPQGFYLVWDEKQQMQPLADVIILKPVNAKKFYRVGGDAEMSPEMLYQLNVSIKDIPIEKITKIFPTPAFYQEGKGAFNINTETRIIYAEGFKKEAYLLNANLADLLGKDLDLSSGVKAGKNSIQILKDDSPAEAYQLLVTQSGIIIKAGTASGVFYAIQSLKTLLNPNVFALNKQQYVTVKAVTVKDHPRFGYRALMLDVARNFQSKKQVKKMIDLMALYKLNALHFHLNDDEGWRLEIPSLPELTELGSKRAHVFDGTATTLAPSYGSGPFANQSSGSGYYSKSDFIEILKYAAEKHIQVIPEIETPGHARAAIKSMDLRYQNLMQLGKKEEAEKYLLHDFKDESVYRSVQKWNDHVMDVAMPSVYDFLELVTDEMIGMYKEAGVPLTTIHFGGDEVPNGVWEKSPAFEALKRENAKIEGTENLWDYFFDKIYRMLDKRGLFLSGWEEVALHKVKVNGVKKWIPNEDFKDRNIHVNVWNNLLGNEDLAYRLANAGYKVNISFVNNFYLDMAYHKHFDEPGFYWGGFTNLEKPFSFIPFDYLKNQKENYLGRPLSDKVLTEAVKLTDTGKKNINGIQGQLWSETVKNPEQMEYLILPRLLALAERAWTASPDWAEETDPLKASKAYSEDLNMFDHQVGQRELKRLDHYAGGFNYRIPSPGLKQIGDLVFANVELPGFSIRYSTDGSMPTPNSPIYHKPLIANPQLVFRVFNEQGRGGAMAQIHQKEN